MVNPYKPKTVIPVKFRCPECHGSGHVPKMTFPFMWFPKDCPQCEGSGRVT